MKHKRFILLIVILAIIALVGGFIKRITEDSENVNSPLGCATQWVDDVRTLNETIDCINFYMEKINDTKSSS